MRLRSSPRINTIIYIIPKRRPEFSIYVRIYIYIYRKHAYAITRRHGAKSRRSTQPVPRDVNQSGIVILPPPPSPAAPPDSHSSLKCLPPLRIYEWCARTRARVRTHTRCILRQRRRAKCASSPRRRGEWYYCHGGAGFHAVWPSLSSPTPSPSTCARVHFACMEVRIYMRLFAYRLVHIVYAVYS